MTSDERPILLLAGSGFIIRNLLLGTFAAAVAERRPLVVAVQNPDDTSLSEIVKSKNITLLPFLFAPDDNSQSWTSWQPYMFRFKATEIATKGMELHSHRYDHPHTLIGAASIRVLKGLSRTLKRAHLLGVVERCYLNSVGGWPVTAGWREVFDRWRPALVVSTLLSASVKKRASEDLPAVVAAHQRGLRCGTLVQSWDNLSSKPSVLPPWVDRYWTWSGAMSEELLALHPRISPDRVKTVGSPQFDYHRDAGIIEPRETFLGRLGLVAGRPVVLIGTGTPARLPYEPAMVMSLLRALRASLPRCQVVIRLHPKDDGARWGELREQISELGAVLQETAPPVRMDAGGFVPPKEFYREQVNSLVHASVVVNVCSTLTVDAAVLDRPVVCVGYDVTPDPKYPEGRAWTFTQTTHYARLVATGGMAVVRSEAECLNAVARYLQNPELDSAGRRRIVEIVTGAADGKAGERLAKEVLALAASGVSRQEKYDFAQPEATHVVSRLKHESPRKETLKVENHLFDG